MEDAAQITSDVTTRMSDFNDRFVRMDGDFDRWDMKRASQRGTAEYVAELYRTGGKARDTDIEVIGNDFRTFSDDVQSILSSSERQIAVRMAETEGEDMREAMGKLERLLEYGFEKADERLIDLLMGTLKENLVWYSIVRGWVAGRFLVYKVGKNVIFDFLPYDPRWLVYQTGANGLLWTAYTTSSSPEALEDEYGKIKRKSPWYKPWAKEAKSYDVIDYWKYEDAKKISNAIICEGEFLKEPEEYKIDSMPVLIAPVATRPPIRGNLESEMKGYGESIFAPNRQTGDLLNKLASMWASHANLLYKQPIVNYRGPQGIEIKDTLHYAGGVINLPAGENKLDEVPMKEISATLVNLVNWAESKRVRGSLPDINVGSPPPSGTLYNLVQETSNRVFNPQLRNLNSFYSNICRLVEEQLLAGGVGGDKIRKFKIQGQLKNKYFEDEITPPDLKRAHIIKVEFTARTPWTQMDTYQIADMAKRQGLPDGFIQEYILKLPDPKGLGDLSAIEMAEHSPKLAMVRAIQALVKQGREDEAGQLMQDMYNLQMQEEAQTQGMEQGAMPQEAPTERPPPPEMGGGI